MKMLSYSNLCPRLLTIHVTFIVNKAIIQNSVRGIFHPIGTGLKGTVCLIIDLYFMFEMSYLGYEELKKYFSKSGFSAKWKTILICCRRAFMVRSDWVKKFPN